MDEPAPDRPPVPLHFAAQLPPNVAALLHRTAYQTGRSKVDLVVTAIEQVYGEAERAA